MNKESFLIILKDVLHKLPSGKDLIGVIPASEQVHYSLISEDLADIYDKILAGGA